MGKYTRISYVDFWGGMLQQLYEYIICEVLWTIMHDCKHVVCYTLVHFMGLYATNLAPHSEASWHVKQTSYFVCITLSFLFTESQRLDGSRDVKKKGKDLKKEKMKKMKATVRIELLILFCQSQKKNKFFFSLVIVYLALVSINA